MTMQRRPMQWFTSEQALGPLTAATAQTNLILYSVLSQSNAAVKGATVTRMLVDLVMGGASLAQDIRMHWGITVVNADARAAGVFPDPSDLAETVSWLARGRLIGIQSDLSDSSQRRYAQLDIRSQRVLRSEKDELHLIVDNAGPNTFNWAAWIRVLMKLP